MANFELEKQFNSIKKSAVDAVKEIFPIEGKIRTIRLDKVWVDDTQDSTDYSSQTASKNKESTWGAPVYAALTLLEKAGGKEVDKVAKVKLFTLPKLTSRFSYIVNGNEYQVQSQLRLKPGVYTLRKQNGELKTQINLARGKNFDLAFNERTGVFYIQKIGGGQANIPLYPVLTYLGISPTMISERWGGKLESANRVTDPKAVSKAAAAFGAKDGGLKEYFSKTEINPEVTASVLGQSFQRVDGPLLLAASKHLLDVHLGSKTPTDRDSLAFKELHSLEDYLHERIQKNKQSLSFKLKRNIDNVRRVKLSQLVNPGAFNSVVETFFTQDDKSATPEQTNPLEMLTGQYKVTIMGSGGIKSDHAITPEMREIHPSHYGFLDPIHTPECYDEDTEVLTFHGWKRWRDVDIGDLFACRINGRLEFHRASKIHKSLYSGVMFGVQNGKIDYLVTPNHRMYVRPLESKSDAWRIEEASQTHGKPRTFCVSHEEYRGSEDKRFSLQHVAGSNASVNVKDVDIEDWCELVGWFVSEGCLTYVEKTSSYLLTISQCSKANPEKCKKIEALLSRLPWRWCRTRDKNYIIGVKQLAHYFKDQGLGNTKFIPKELFSAPASARKKLLEAMLLGDGRTYSTRTKIPTYKQQVYCTTSPQLAKDFEMLATGLGHSVTTGKYKDNREGRYLDTYEVRILQNNVRSARKWNHRSKKNDYYTKQYTGMVYCATVPGGLLLVKRGDGIAVWLGNSSKIGANLHLPLGTTKDGKSLKTTLLDRNNKPVRLAASEVFDKYVAFPGQKGQVVKVIHKGKVEEVDRSKVEYSTPSPQFLLSWSSNLIPYLPSNQGNRAMMASKMLEQAISLKHREAPLVQVGFGAGTTESIIGGNQAAYSPTDGVVKKVTKDLLTIRGTDGKDVKVNLYNNFPLNRKSFITHEVRVKEGDSVKKGQLLADNNYSKDGVLALGTNMRVAYLPYKGLNHDDGIVITSSAATKLTSEHIHKKSVELSENIILNLPAFTSFYPNAITGENIRKLDKDGVIKKGSRIKQGEALATIMQKRSPSATVASFSRVLSDRPKDVSAYWTLEDDGEVIDVQRSGKRITILVKTEEAAKIGDKLSGRMGNKGIVTKIISDDEAPRDKSGKPVDILLNPHGVISRINIGQIYESAAGKVAQKTGSPIRVDNFSGENYLESTRSLLKKHGIDDKEELFDPISKKSLGKVHVGSPYILKLFKQGTVNYSVRQGGPGHPYDANQQPLKAGGEEAAKSMDLLTVYSMLSHGARANLREMASVKSNQNDEFWKALKSGQPLPQPDAPFVYEKFLHYLKGAGINPVKQGSKIVLAPLTDADVRSQSNGQIKKNFFYRGKDMEPVKGGFFDPALTGGYKGARWNHLELKEPTINPVFENAVRKITGLGKKLDEVIAGKMHLDKDGKFNTEGRGVTGGYAIEKILKAVDVDTELASLKKKAINATGATLDDVNKRMRYLTALKTNKMTANEAYMRKSLPILPPMYRPVYPLPDGSMTTSDINILYQNTGVVNEMMHLPVMDLLPEEEKGEIRKDMYEHVKSVSGLTDMNIKGRVREGLISEIKGGTGGQPKEGFFISKMISKKQDYVGRGTIIPEPDLGIDEVALPEEMAWKLFEPFIVKELRNHGKMPLQATEEIKHKSPLARRALELVMKERHVLLNRAPSLHKFSIMAFRPQITSGRAIKVPPLVGKGFNLDYDGDTMTAHVPITDEANDEAKKMLPSRNLFQPGSDKLMITPSQEAQVGIFYLSKTPAGRTVINKLLGPKYAISDTLDRKKTGDLLHRIAKEVKPQEYAKIVAGLKAAGESHAYDRGFTLGLNDLADISKERNKIVDLATSMSKGVTDPKHLAEINKKTTDLIDKVIERKLKDTNNPLYDMVASGAKGEKSQLRSIIATPLFMTDARGATIARPIKTSYSEGLDVSDYWLSMYGARRGGMDRSIQTSLPGAFSKDIMASTIDNVISGVDCGTKDGIKLKADDRDALDRYLAGDQGGVAHNTLINNQVQNLFKRAGLKEIKVRSPLTCHQARGVCAKCHGLDEHGELPGMGENIGAKAGQTISEPLIQMIMNSRHTGGVAGTGADAGGYKRINQLLQLPKIVQGSSTLSPKNGVVTKIEKGLAGGFNVYIGTDVAYVAQGRALKIKVGSKVEAGDPLSDGVIRPQDLVKYKGMQKAQEHMVDELQNVYKNQGASIQKRIFETIIRSIGNTTRVVNNPKSSDHLPGDVMPYTVAQAYNRNLVITVPTEEITGYRLAQEGTGLKVGKELTKDDVVTLKAKGLKEVKVEKDAIVHTPFLKGMSTLPLLKKDWMGGLGYRYLAKGLTEGASQRWETDLSGYHPIPGLAHGSTFGKGKDGKY